ncbi:MAG: exodeoxyribonuclease VII small subunit [Burkholderiaceae bacterium]
MPRKSTSESAAEPAAAALSDDIRALSFEQAIDSLEEIVARMESGELPLQASLEAYERGAALVAHCRGALEQARQQVKVFEDGLLRPFEADSDEDDD